MTTNNETCGSLQCAAAAGELRGKGKVKALWFKNTRFHRVIPGFMMQGGDITHGALAFALATESIAMAAQSSSYSLSLLMVGNGAGGVAALGTTFEDEVHPVLVFVV